jgi:hypothetical protein
MTLLFFDSGASSHVFAHSRGVVVLLIAGGLQQGHSGKLLETVCRTQCSGALGMSSCTWGDAKTFISVQYAADKVVLFSGQGLE